MNPRPTSSQKWNSIQPPKNSVMFGAYCVTGVNISANSRVTEVLGSPLACSVTVLKSVANYCMASPTAFRWQDVRPEHHWSKSSRSPRKKLAPLMALVPPVTLRRGTIVGRTSSVVRASKFHWWWLSNTVGLGP